jgi:hypothetical protein
MNYPHQDRPARLRFGGKTVAGRYAKAILAISALLGVIVVSGCSRGIPGLVPVSGKLTSDGGPWPKRGSAHSAWSITFSCTKKVGDHPTLPAEAHLNEDGSFVVQSSSSMGMVPGEYVASIRCWLEDPAEDGTNKGKSAVAEQYRRTQTSPLKVSVPEGSGPIVLDWDIPSK